jgi:hypothetical protein
LRIPCAGLVLALLLVSSPALSQSARQYAPDGPFVSADNQLLCELMSSQPALERAGFASFATEVSEQSRLENLAQKIIWKQVPKQVRCGSTSIQLKQKGYGNSLESLGRSPDGQLAAFAGGYLYGPMHGGGGECIFRRDEANWKLEGCLRTWDV